MKLKSSILSVFSVALALFGSGCATQIRMSQVANPPPAEAFSSFSAFELKSATLASAYANNDANKKALAKIQERLTSQLQPVFESWGKESKAASNRTLVVAPVITEIKFVGGAVRVFFGAFAGSSAIIAQVSIVEKETGNVVDSPIFYASSRTASSAASVGARMGAGFGVVDNLMLDQIADNIAAYIKNNYASAIGGRTGGQ